MGKRRTLTLVVGVLLGAVLLSSARAFAQDPFAGLTNTLNSSARTWAAALMLVGALIAGGAIMMGSRESGHHTRNFLFGAVFLVMASAGLAIYDRVAGLLR
jgi:drug/metabolite transporter (DMT)-like permease